MNEKPDHMLTEWLVFGSFDHKWRRCGRYMEIAHRKNETPDIPPGFYVLKFLRQTGTSNPEWNISLFDVPGWSPIDVVSPERPSMESCFVQIYPQHLEPVVDTHAQLHKWQHNEIEFILHYPTTSLDLWFQTKRNNVVPYVTSLVNDWSFKPKTHYVVSMSGGYSVSIDTQECSVGDKIKITFSEDFDFVKVDFKTKPTPIAETKPQYKVTSTTFTLDSGIMITLPSGYVVDFDKLSQAFVLGPKP